MPTAVIDPIRQAVILAGGFGTRLGQRAAGLPKAMVPCGGRPFLSWILRELARFGIEEVVLLTGHRGEVIEAALPRLAATLPKSMVLRCVQEATPAGTAGALRQARAHLQPRFLLCNGDSWLDCNLMPLLNGGPASCRMLLHPVADGARFGTVELDGDRVTAFREKDGAGPALINAGLYVMAREIVDGMPTVGSLEHDVLPGLAASGGLRGTRAEGWFIDIGVPAALDRAQAEVPRRLLRRALFLDRDGVINHDHGWVGTEDRFVFVDGAIETIRAATDRGWHVFVVTNQSGIGRGLYSEAQFAALTAWMIQHVRAHDGTVDDFRYCPFHPDAALPAYRRESDWRKPAPGMILDLMARWEIDPARCLLIGDRMTDVEAGQAAGVPTYLFPGGNLHAFVAPLLAATAEP